MTEVFTLRAHTKPTYPISTARNKTSEAYG